MQITKIVLFFLFGATMASSQVQITGSQMILGTATSNACPISPCSIATGGTGATTASQALTNLGALPEAGGTISGQLGIGSVSYVQEVNGDLWITANAYWDGSNWQRVDITKASFGLQLQGTNNFPYESIQGGTLWVASAHANPINSTYGSTYGWRIGWTIQSALTMVLGGAGIEVDGDGSIPYGRFFHNTISSLLYTGMLTNAFVDFSGVDSASYPSWFAGFVGDEFEVLRAAAGAGTTWATLATINPSGQLGAPSFAVNGVAMSSVPKMVWSASIPVLTAAANVLSANWAPSSAITITQFAIFLATPAVGCSTGQTYGMYDSTTSTWLGTVTLYNSQASTTLGLTAAVTAGDILSFGIQTAATGCSTSPANASVLAEYRMQ